MSEKRRNFCFEQWRSCCDFGVSVRGVYSFFRKWERPREIIELPSCEGVNDINSTAGVENRSGQTSLYVVGAKSFARLSCSFFAWPSPAASLFVLDSSRMHAPLQGFRVVRPKAFSRILMYTSLFLSISPSLPVCPSVCLSSTAPFLLPRPSASNVWSTSCVTIRNKAVRAAAITLLGVMLRQGLVSWWRSCVSVRRVPRQKLIWDSCSARKTMERLRAFEDKFHQPSS